jgi:hypothetical protein
LIGPKAAFGASLPEDADDPALLLRSRLWGRRHAVVESKWPQAHRRRVNVSRRFYRGFAANAREKQKDRTCAPKVSHMPSRAESTFHALVRARKRGALVGEVETSVSALSWETVIPHAVVYAIARRRSRPTPETRRTDDRLHRRGVVEDRSRRMESGARTSFTSSAT